MLFLLFLGGTKDNIHEACIMKYGAVRAVFVKIFIYCDKLLSLLHKLVHQHEGSRLSIELGTRLEMFDNISKHQQSVNQF